MTSIPPERKIQEKISVGKKRGLVHRRWPVEEGGKKRTAEIQGSGANARTS